MKEFPILEGGKVFDGSSGPGPDRIILEYVITSFRYNPALIHLLSAHSVTSALASPTPGLLRVAFAYAHELMNYFRVMVYKNNIADVRMDSSPFVFSTVCVINGTVDQSGKNPMWIASSCLQNDGPLSEKTPGFLLLLAVGAWREGKVATDPSRESLSARGAATQTTYIVSAWASGGPPFNSKTKFPVRE